MKVSELLQLLHTDGWLQLAGVIVNSSTWPSPVV
jgi:hypothetical protein